MTTYPRRDLYPASGRAATGSISATALGFEAPMYGDSTRYVLNGRASPDEGDARLSSLGLSSAPSSAMGSPQSNHGQLSAAPEWSAHGLAVQPGIVGNDYMEYLSGPGIRTWEASTLEARNPARRLSVRDCFLSHCWRPCCATRSMPAANSWSLP